MGRGSCSLPLQDAARLRVARPKAATLATVRTMWSLPQLLSPFLIWNNTEKLQLSSASLSSSSLLLLGYIAPWMVPRELCRGGMQK